MLRFKKLTSVQFYALSFTWGFLMTIIGLLTAGVLMLAGKQPIANQYGWYFVIGKRNWGGLDLGMVSLVCPQYNDHLLNHEFGHAIQNCYFGPFFIFIWLASAARYQIRGILTKMGKSLPPYDSIWFEGQATALGEKYKETI